MLNIARPKLGMKTSQKLCGINSHSPWGSRPTIYSKLEQYTLVVQCRIVFFK